MRNLAGLSKRWPQRTLEERFWQKVDKGADDVCWVWKGWRYPSGYGHFQIGVLKKETAHRMAYKLSYPDFDPNLDVCHRCDNPPCCNPKHLWQGTHKENMADMRAKGRNRKAPV